MSFDGSSLDIDSMFVNISRMAVERRESQEKQARARPAGCCPLRPVAALPDPRRQRLLRAFKALADPTRLEILRLLRAQPGATCVCDIVDHFELAQPTISHHLKVLREAGLLTHSRVGIWSFYALDPRAPALLDEAEARLA
jgi:ArsR family transcriptional regulator